MARQRICRASQFARWLFALVSLNAFVLSPGLAADRQDAQMQKAIKDLKNKKSGIRKEAAMTLCKFKDPRALDALIAALKDTDPDVRGGAAWSLGFMQDPRAVDPLIPVLKDPVQFVRWRASGALG